VYINLEKCYSLAELYVRSVYLNLFGWKGQQRGGGHSLGASWLKYLQKSMG